MVDESAGISIILTVKNEAKNLPALFKTLENQEGPFEIVIVDSDSTDNTAEIIAKYSGKMKINHLVKKSTRGEGRNLGVENSTYPNVIFIDGDVTVNPQFVEAYRKEFMAGFELIAGDVVPHGVEKFKLERVKLFYKDFEITRPSANLGYTKALFQKLNGFDPKFVTAEDIDLNLKAAKSGAKYTVCKDCIVYNRTRESYGQFFNQAFWNGYGRRQLKVKNREIWNTIEKGEKIGKGALIPHILRLGFGGLGYIYAILTN